MNLSGVGYERGTQEHTSNQSPPRGAALAQQLNVRAGQARALAGSTIRQGATTVATSSRRRRRVRKLRVNGAVSEAEVRDLLTWAESTLTPKARWHRLGGLAGALAFAIFVVFWPFMVIIGAGLGFGGAFVCYLAVLAAMAPFALLGERDKAHDVIETLSPTGATDGWRSNAGSSSQVMWPG